MNEDFQQDLGLQEQAVEDEMRTATAAAAPDLSQGIDLGDPALTTPTVGPAVAQTASNPNQTEPIRANPNELPDDELTNLAVQHIKSLGGDVQFPNPNQPEQPQTNPNQSEQIQTNPDGTNDALAAQQFDHLARSIAVNLTQEAGASGAAQEVYAFITQLGPDSVAAYQTNSLFRDMVDVKIDSIVSGHSKGLEERDRLPLPASEMVGGSTEKELRAGLKGHRQAFERAGLSEHMSFDDFIRDIEL